MVRPGKRLLVVAVAALLVAAASGVLIVKVTSLDRRSERLEADLERVRAANAELRADLRRTESAAAVSRRRAGRLREEVQVRQTCAGRGSEYGGPHLVLVPDQGPPGTRVTVVGDCFKGRRWNHGYGIFLIRGFTRPRSCEIIAGASPFRLRVDATGRARGFFTVPSRGGCFQEDYGRRVTPGVYQVGLGCHACGTARFRVTR